MTAFVTPSEITGIVSFSTVGLIMSIFFSVSTTLLLILLEMFKSQFSLFVFSSAILFSVGFDSESESFLADLNRVTDF